ncbi:MAG: hypothetical protein FWC50_06880 [Planctomycetaceae bacterium]|nr:hypothetical protein [Planctomycetaceae bacterium]
MFATKAMEHNFQETRAISAVTTLLFLFFAVIPAIPLSGNALCENAIGAESGPTEKIVAQSASTQASGDQGKSTKSIRRFLKQSSLVENAENEESMELKKIEKEEIPTLPMVQSPHTVSTSPKKLPDHANAEQSPGQFSNQDIYFQSGAGTVKKGNALSPPSFQRADSQGADDRPDSQEERPSPLKKKTYSGNQTLELPPQIPGEEKISAAVASPKANNEEKGLALVSASGTTNARSRDREDNREQDGHDHDGEGALPQTPKADVRTNESDLSTLDVSVMKSAAFQGIFPGKTTREELLELMGEPSRTARQEGFEVMYYTMEGFSNIEVNLQKGVVFSLVVRLDEPFPAEQIREALESELKGIRSLLIPDANGNILGQLFPEKGVVFVFTPSEEPGVPSLMVTQIGIEPITAEPFALRGERYLSISNTQAKWDLTIATRLDPGNHKAHWLLGKACLNEGNLSEAKKEVLRAIELYDKQPQYHITLAQIIADAGHLRDAQQYIREIIPYCSNTPQVKGLAECLLGDFYQKDDNPNYKDAIDYHQKAIETVAPVLASKNPTQRQQAKEVLVKAHLGAAVDVALSSWDGKDEALKKWLGLANEYALDLVIKENMPRDYLLLVASTALSAYLGNPNSGDIEKYVDEVRNIGQEIITQSDDPVRVRKVNSEMGTALYHAVQIYQLRKDYKSAISCGKIAADYLERGTENSANPVDIYQLARLYFRLGAIQANGMGNHREAVKWFEKAIPLFQKVDRIFAAEEQPKLGEMYVSIGISYWEIGEQEYAIQISEYGVAKLEKAVENGLLKEKALAVPYGNLSVMYRKVGRDSDAEDYYLLSKQLKGDVVSGRAASLK